MSLRFAELHCKTNYSFLVGASHPEELVEQAIQLGYEALAITDENSLAGVVRAFAAARQTHLKLIIGAEITPHDALPVILWAPDRAAYGRLCRLITLGRLQADKGDCAIDLDAIAQHADGLLAGVLPGTNANELHVYRDLFGDRCYLLAELDQGPDDRQRLWQLARFAERAGIPLVAAGNVHYHSPHRMPLHHVLTAIRNHTTVAEAGELLSVNAQRYLQPLAQRQATFTEFPAALHRTIEIADRCTFRLDELRYEYPRELAPDGTTPMEFLRDLTWQGARQRYEDDVPDDVKLLIKKELTLIDELRYEAYFLTVWDLVRFARSRQPEILCQGRGSAANSVVCYCLGVTEVDPEKIDLLFERFVSKERDQPPDIDIDFEHERREEVLQYLYQKYGRDRSGLAATVVTYRSRSAIRDVGKALGLSLDRIDALAKNGDGHHSGTPLKDRMAEVGIDPTSRTGHQFCQLVKQLVGFPRHLSQHVGGMVITQGPLCELVPIENAAMDDRTVVQWDKDDLEELGILKVDCLSLGMLTAIRKCFELIEAHGGERYTLATIPGGDNPTYDMICQADTIGVFQIESRAQMSMLPRLKPRSFYDLVIEVSIVRPGPIQGKMVHPYLRRREGEEDPDYPNDQIEAVLEKTFGVPIFQEQAMRLAEVAAGFTPGEADQLRRAMGGWRRPGIIEQFEEKLITGMRASGLSEEFASRVFQQIRGFGEYGFPESHAASFAILAYASSWLKCHHPAAFTAALLNSQPMGFYAPAQLIRDVQRKRVHLENPVAVDVLPADVNHSQWDCTLEKQSSGNVALRLGFRLIKGLTRETADRIVQCRRTTPFTSIDQFTQQTGFKRSIITRLSQADAFASLQQDRRCALWQALGQASTHLDQPLFADLPPEDHTQVQLPKMDPRQQVYADYQATGLSLKGHPLAFYRDQLDQASVTPANQLAETAQDRPVQVAGLVLGRQRPGTAKNITFVTLEDETGIVNLIVKKGIWDRYRQIARHSQLWLAQGKLEMKHSVIHLIVSRIEDLSCWIQQPRLQSRDFH